MKKPADKGPVNVRAIEKDLKALFESEDYAFRDTTHQEPESDLSLDQALKLFDRLRETRSSSSPSSREPKWTHPSVFTLGEGDPISTIALLARKAVLKAIEEGWSGPPYNPFTLAEMRGIRLLPTEAVLDARTYSDAKGRFITEFNPQRSAARMRYSIAHEIGHTLFRDCADSVRHRATHQEMKDDDWQLESLCNIAAAEILMPFGTLQDELSIRPSAALILDLRRKYLASCEAVTNRLIRLSAYPCFAFFARLSDVTSRYFVEYRITSPALDKELGIHRGYVLPHSSKASACTAIGARDQEDAQWMPGGEKWFIEYLGISPNTGETHPRVLALAFPPVSPNFTISEPLRFLPGDASEPFGAEPKLLLQVVNDQALIWGGGFAKQARKKWPQAQTDFREWAYGRRNLKLGNIHSVSVRDDLTLVSLVAQKGFKPSAGPKLKYGSLFLALEKVAELATARGATVHMPRIGTGEAGGSWNIIEGIIRETLVSRRIPVTIYDLHPRGADFSRQRSFEYPQTMADELI
ncbi:MAG TPA: ImmA/IrrE family metallo-endopeptidase [Terriglobales bacterium]|nr:ImmA/IrrE family metallo-endopeptidase [Terriglobales bacterium]